VSASREFNGNNASFPQPTAAVRISTAAQSASLILLDASIFEGVVRAKTQKEEKSLAASVILLAGSGVRGKSHTLSPDRAQHSTPAALHPCQCSPQPPGPVSSSEGWGGAGRHRRSPPPPPAYQLEAPAVLTAPS